MLLVNNAGVMLGAIDGADTEDPWRRMIEADVLGLMWPGPCGTLPLLKAQIAVAEK
jgi:NADP-dependent 3-hydroxy acid dehydrogenase YdfG